MEDQLARVIAKVNLLKDHAALQLGIGDSTILLVGVLPSPHVGTPGGLVHLTLSVFSGVDQFHIPFVFLWRLVHQVKDPLGSGRSSDHKVYLHTHLGNGIGKTFVQAHKGDHSTQGHPGQTVDSQHSAHNGHQGVTEPADIAIDGHKQVGVSVGHVGAVPQGVIYLTEIGLSLLLVAEYLDHLLSIQHLFNKSVYRPQILLLFDIIFSGQPGEVLGYQQHDCGGEQRNHRQRRTEHDHSHQSCRHGNAGVDDLGNALTDKLPQSVHIIGIHGHDVAVGMGIKVFDGQGLHFGKQVVPEVAQSPLAYIDHDAVIAKGSHNAHRHNANQTNQFSAQSTEVGRTIGQHRLDIVVHQGLGKGSPYHSSHSGHQDAHNDQCEQIFIVVKHIADNSTEYTAPVHFRIHNWASSFHAGWSKSPPPLT